MEQMTYSLRDKSRCIILDDGGTSISLEGKFYADDRASLHLFFNHTLFHLFPRTLDLPTSSRAFIHMDAMPNYCYFDIPMGLYSWLILIPRIQIGLLYSQTIIFQY
jgi:hypothetical protein